MSAEKVLRLKYAELIFIVAAKVFAKVFEKLGQKKLEDIVALKKWSKYERAYLEELTSHTIELNQVDILLLYEIIRETCDLSKTDQHWANETEDYILENSLFKIKKYRNVLAHNYNNPKLINRDTWRDVVNLLEKIIDEVHKKIIKGVSDQVTLNISLEEREQWKQELKRDLEELKSITIAQKRNGTMEAQCDVSMGAEDRNWYEVPRFEMRSDVNRSNWGWFKPTTVQPRIPLHPKLVRGKVIEENELDNYLKDWDVYFSVCGSLIRRIRT